MFSIIVAHSKNNIIGKDNKIPWYIPDDLKRFKEITTGKTIIMGRKTFQSLPCVLPNRKHIILTENKDFIFNDSNVEICTDINEIIEKYQTSDEEVFIIGGGEIYSKFLDLSTKLFITEIDINLDGDSFFPKLDISKWSLVFESDKNIFNDMTYTYKNYIKK